MLYLLFNTIMFIDNFLHYLVNIHYFIQLITSFLSYHIFNKIIQLF